MFLHNNKHLNKKERAMSVSHQINLRFSFRQSLTISPEQGGNWALWNRDIKATVMGQKFFSPVFFKNSSLLKECESIFIEMEIYFYSLFIFHHPPPHPGPGGLHCSPFIEKDWITDGKQKVVKDTPFLDLGFQKPEFR